MKRWFWVLDALTVVSFVVIGRDNHGFATDWAETVRVAVPFLLALAVGIVVTKAWLNPTSLLVGLGIATVTVVLGLLLRRFIFDGGTASTFVWLTAGWMIAWMVVWRVVAHGIERFVHHREASSTA